MREVAEIMMKKIEWVRSRGLNHEEKEQAMALILAEEALLKAQIKVNGLKARCTHRVLEVNIFESFEDNETGTVRCALCNKGFGWFCPKSPDRYCHYPETPSPNGDVCIFCGQPDERD